ncbi:MAG TPA: hypothetical protein VFT64_01570 [Rickettsiales bacterium]|nr:hypothetical protein [Rickettsiales bacterium]
MRTRLSPLIVPLLCLLLSRQACATEEKITPTAESKHETSAEAPFGLKWGMKEEDAMAGGITLVDISKPGDGKGFTATGLSKTLSDTGVVFLNFGYDDKLWLIVAVSKSFTNDPYGTAVSARYNELSSLLEKKYGKGEVRHINDQRLYTRADEFLAGIKNGRTLHFTTFKNQRIYIELSIGAESYDSGYYKIRYENTELGKEYEKSKKTNEKDAL